MLKEILFETYVIVLPILLGYVIWILKDQKKTRDANTEGTKMLLVVQMIEYHEKYMALGRIPSNAYDNFHKMYEAYQRMGDGNIAISKMREEIEDLALGKIKRKNACEARGE